MTFKTDIQIAREANKKPIQEIGAILGIESADLIPYGHDKAKVSSRFVEEVKSRKNGKLILVPAINPTPAGEGKTTTTVGLGDGLNRIGQKAAICIREASLGPNFGMKGGAAGGGYAQIVPMEDMNLHFTGGFHAITSAHNLLSAMPGSLCLPPARAHFCDDVARAYGGTSSPTKYGLNGTMPATVNMIEGSCGIKLAEGTTVWSRDAKKSRKERRN